MSNPPLKCPDTLLELARIFPNYVRDPNDFKTDNKIGKGGFGIVYHGIDLKTKKEVAVKELLSKHLKGKFLSSYIREIYTMAVCDCRWIVPLIGFSVTFPYSIVTEYEVNGTLDRFIFHKSNKSSPTHLTSVAMCLAFTLAHIHEKNIIYRDLKSNNILMDQDLLPRLCDFGIARFVETSGIMTRRIGTPSYMAPELLNSFAYTVKVDEYAFGCLLYEMCESKTTFSGKNVDEICDIVYQKGERPSFTSSTPHDFKKLITKLWSPDPTDRPSFEEIYKMFADGKISFPKSDKSRIKKLASQIEKNAEKRKEKGKELPPIFVDIEKVYEKLSNPQDDDDDDDYALSAEQELEMFGESQGKAPSPSHSPSPSASQNKLKSSSSQNEFNSSPANSNQPPSNPMPVPIRPPSNQPFPANLPPPPIKKLLDTSIIAKPESIQWPTGVINLLLQVTPPSVPEFVNAFETVLNKGGERGGQGIVALTRLMKASEEASQYVCQSQIITKRTFNFSDQRISSTLCDLYSVLFIKYPKYLSSNDLPIITNLLKIVPNKVIALYCKLSRTLPIPSGAMPLIDALFSNLEFLTGEGLNLIKFINQILNDPVIRRDKLAQIKTVLLYFLSSADISASITAIKALANNFSEFYELDFERLLTTGQDFRFQNSITSLFLRAHRFPPSRRVCSYLIGLANKSKEGHFALLNFITSSLECATICAQDPTWYTLMLPSAEDSFRVLVTLFLYPACRDAVTVNPGFPSLLTNILSCTADLPILALASIMRRAPITPAVAPHFFARIDAIQFVEKYISAMEQHWNENVLSNGMALIDHLARLGESVAFPNIIPICLRALSVQQLQASAITLLTVLSSKRSCYNALRNDEIINYFKTLANYPDYLAYATQFLTNVGAQ